MSFNPFEQKPENIEKLFCDWKTMYPQSYSKNDVSPFTKLRCILTNGAEYEAVWFSHQFFRHCTNNDLRRELALIRKSEQAQQKIGACLKPKDETVLETTIGYEQLAVELTAMLAMREPDKRVKAALDFALLEDFDHLYRYADLLDMEHGVHAENLVGELTEIMPARPTITHHRYPKDEVKKPVDFKKASPVTKLDVAIITAAEQQTMNYYMNQCGFYETDLGRRLYQEIAMVEEQHVSQYGSLMDVKQSWLEGWLCHEYTECYVYYSCFKDETDKHVKKIWEMCLLQEITHLHKACECLEKYGKKNWQEVIPDGNFPELLAFKSTKNYVRNVIANTVCNTAHREGYVSINDLDDNAEFFTYQKIVNANEKMTPSHSVIDAHIDKEGKDYRYENSPSPVESLRSRTKDNTTLGRVKNCKLIQN